MATFYKKKSDAPGYWSKEDSYWWTGPGWYGGDDGRQSTAAPDGFTPTTPTELAQTMDWSNVSGKSAGSGASGTPLTYQALKDAGMWDLADPNSVTWQWLDERYGGGAGLQGVSREEMLGRSLFDLKVPTSEYGTAFQGLDPQFMQGLQGEVGRITEVHKESAKNQDWTEKYLEPLVNPITLGALAFGYLPGVAESGLASGGASALSGGTSANGGGMWDWIDTLMGETGEFGMDPGMLEGGFNPAGSGFDMSGLSSPDWVNDLLKETGEFGLDPSTLEGGFNPAGGGFDFGTNPLDQVKKFYRALTGNDSASGGGTGRTQGRDILDLFLGDPLQAAFNSTPFLLALSEANRQGDDLDGVIGKINGEAYSRSILNPYDMDTGLGRTNMIEDQQRRGVRGSSFGDQSLGNYDYMRSLGRGDLFNRSNLASAQLEGNLINTRNTNRNLLLGAGLNASGRMFEPQQDPFSLKSLLGIK